MDPEKKRKRKERYQRWLREDPLNRQLRAAIERYRKLAEERRRATS